MINTSRSTACHLVALGLTVWTPACGSSFASGTDAGATAPVDAYVPPGIDAPFFTDAYVPPGVDAPFFTDAASTSGVDALLVVDASFPPGTDAALARPDAATPTATVGTPCDDDGDCPGLFCSTAGAGFGYCSWLCTDSMPCPGEAVCARFGAATSYGYCMPPCDAAAADCPRGTRCQSGIADEPVCYPGCTTDADCPAGRRCGVGVSGVEQCFAPGAETGQPCDGSEECPEAGYCLDEARWGTPGGLCTTFCDLGSGAGCESGTTCVSWGFMSGAGACIPTCDDMSPCRDGYQCVSTGPGGPRACVSRCETSDDCTGGRECNFVTGRCG
jgi:hypothetical protein